MQQFDIELPKEVLTPGKHEQINFSSLEGKVVLGLTGYAKSGKDSIAKIFVNDYGYQRVAFADNIKKEMNLFLKEAVYNDVIKRNEHLAFWNKYGIRKFDDIEFFTENLELKKVIRPYIIWYGEKLRTINGRFCWINRALSEDGKDMDKIVLSDVRRLAELDVFRNSNEFKKRQKQAINESGAPTIKMIDEVNNYGTLLFEVSQMGLIDRDALTIETIQAAREQWLIDDTFMVNPLIPDGGNYRQKAMEVQIKRVTKKFGIDKVDKTKHPQSNIFQSPIPFFD